MVIFPESASELDLLKVGGRRLFENSFDALTKRLEPNETLVMRAHSAIPQVVILRERAVFDACNDRYKKGEIALRSFFALPSHVLPSPKIE